MKKLTLTLALCLFALAALVGCSHTHAYTPGNPSVATCTDASVVRYTCTCGDFYDAEVSAALGHEMTKTDAVAVTCDTDGNPAYYTCSRCEKHYADEVGETELAPADLVIPAGHQTIHHPVRMPHRFEDGNFDYFECTLCAGVYWDAGCTQPTTIEDVTLLSEFNLVDFVVEVEEGRDPVVLQLTDPQFIDATHIEARAFAYMRETILATKPDLILVTGDLIYGKYETTGESFSAFVAFMDSFGIPWAPVFGNHDNELPQGVDWQCEQFDNAEHCLFKRGDLTGNGNYTVAVAQGDRLSRVFYMLDSNGCAAPSAASEGKVKKTPGFAEDQIAWYTRHIRTLREAVPDIKISFAFHIQPAIFTEALKGYGNYFPVYLDKKGDGSIGIIGLQVPTEWDKDFTVWNGLKALGVDSIFVGHEHCISASLVYEGVLLQFGQKSSTYDRHNWIIGGRLGNGWNSETNSWDPPTGAVSIIGGTVNKISAEDGSLLSPYIYLCGNITLPSK